MDRTERFYKIEHLLHSRRVVTVSEFVEELGVSLATFKRDLEYLRDRIQAPIVFDREAGGYRFETPQKGLQHELPGLWFNASEVHALLSMQQLLSNIEPGLLAPQVEPLKTRLMALLAQDDFSAQELQDRIRLVQANQRQVSGHAFELLATATLRRHRVRFTHYHRERDETLVREVSPQQLVFYRYNWYLDGWCHLRNGIRSFAVDVISDVEFIDKPARNVSRAILKKHLESGYGIFAGSKVIWATLKFSPERSRWVTMEQWHPQQKMHRDANGCCILEVPYSDERELLMEILRYGDAVEVLAPPALRKMTRDVLQKAAKRYQ